MRTRFEAVNLPLTIVPPVPWSDSRIRPGDVRIQAVTWGHLTMLQTFVDDPGASYGIFMEDDVFIRRDIATYLPELVAMYSRHALDVFLLGYLQPSPPVVVTPRSGYGVLGVPLTALTYDDDQWGAQMYMMDKRWARDTLMFCSGTVRSPFNPDWIMTKRGRRAMCWPMMGVEEGAITSDHSAQAAFHRQCAAVNYDPSIHI